MKMDINESYKKSSVKVIPVQKQHLLLLQTSLDVLIGCEVKYITWSVILSWINKHIYEYLNPYRYLTLDQSPDLHCVLFSVSITVESMEGVVT